MNQPRVILDDDPDRTRTVTGWPLFSKWLQRTLGFAALVTALVFVVLAPMTPPARWGGLLALGFAGWSLNGVPWFLAILGDWKAKQILARRYNFAPVFGLDTKQRRRMRIIDPPADLRAAVRQCLRGLDSEAVIDSSSPTSVVATLPRQKGMRWMKCRVDVRWNPAGPTDVILDVDSTLNERFGFTDSGRNIIIVEELQLRLKQSLETGREPAPYAWDQPSAD